MSTQERGENLRYYGILCDLAQHYSHKMDLFGPKKLIGTFLGENGPRFLANFEFRQSKIPGIQTSNDSINWTVLDQKLTKGPRRKRDQIFGQFWVCTVLFKSNLFLTPNIAQEYEIQLGQFYSFYKTCKEDGSKI